MQEANMLIEASNSKNTWNTYENAVSTFQKFRRQYCLDLIWPPPPYHLINFLAFLSSELYSPSTAKAYMSAISFVLKLNNQYDTTKSFLIKKMLKGMSKVHYMPDLRLPITADMMLKFPHALARVCNSAYETSLFVAAFSLAFGALLRISEITASNEQSASQIIQKSDISFQKNLMSICIRFSKTDQLGRSTTCQIKSNTLPLCPVKAVTDYLTVRRMSNGPLFCHLNGKYITRNQFLSVLRSALKFSGYDTSNFNTHSFRIGGATFLASQGKSEEFIKIKGRWQSNAYQRYIRC